MARRIPGRWIASPDAAPSSEKPLAPIPHVGPMLVMSGMTMPCRFTAPGCPAKPCRRGPRWSKKKPEEKRTTVHSTSLAVPVVREDAELARGGGKDTCFVASPAVSG